MWVSLVCICVTSMLPAGCIQLASWNVLLWNPWRLHAVCANTQSLLRSSLGSDSESCMYVQAIGVPVPSSPHQCKHEQSWHRLVYSKTQSRNFECFSLHVKQCWWVNQFHKPSSPVIGNFGTFCAPSSLYTKFAALLLFMAFWLKLHWTNQCLNGYTWCSECGPS